jgi:hypothetical protein
MHPSSRPKTESPIQRKRHTIPQELSISLDPAAAGSASVGIRPAIWVDTHRKTVPVNRRQTPSPDHSALRAGYDAVYLETRDQEQGKHGTGKYRIKNQIECCHRALLSRLFSWPMAQARQVANHPVSNGNTLAFGKNKRHTTQAYVEIAAM